MTPREATRTINVGSVPIGGGNTISVQSMTNTDTRDTDATIGQIRRLQDAGCDIVRVAVPDMAAAKALRAIRDNIGIPLVADIHFDYRLALEAVRNGVDKLRINPGNIGSEDNSRAVADAAGARGIPIRIGVNSGSLEDDIKRRRGNAVTAEGLVESALRHVGYLEKHGFSAICVSIKATNIPVCIEAYRLLSAAVDYPLHVGITEAGTARGGAVKSAVGIGAILALGIGDTIRVSLTADPCEEIPCAFAILKYLRLRARGVEFISCPTCGRTGVAMIPLAERVEAKCRDIGKNLTIAVMGCPVNALGEAPDADLGIACGNRDGGGFIFRKGKKVRERLAEAQLYPAFLEELDMLLSREER